MKRGLRLLLAVLLLAVSTPCVACPYPTEKWKGWLEHSTNRYPQRSWMKYAAPEEAGWSSERLRQARDYFQKIDSAAVMVVYDGAVLIEWGDVARRYMCHSIRKSYLSALYGVHVAEGNIELNKTLGELGIDDRPPLSRPEKQARVIDLLRSRSGVFHPAAYETPRMKQRRPPRGSQRPGELFWYNNWDFNALCTIFEQESGTKVFEEFQKRFARPLGMQDFRLQDTYYHLEPEHSVHPAYPFRASTRDMARFGLLFLRRGQWNGRQVLSPQWIQQSTASHFRQSDSTPNPRYGYGYLWWRIVQGPLRELGMYSARGFGGHSIDVLPAANLVFVHRVDTFWDADEHFRQEKTRVTDAQRFELLQMVLRARVSPPKAKPRLVSAAGRTRCPQPVELDPSRLQKYAREYDFREFKLRVKTGGGGLLIGGPGMGYFSLLPLSQTQFVIEDVEAPLAFRLDGQGNPQGVSVEFYTGKPWHGLPVESSDTRRDRPDSDCPSAVTKEEKESGR